MNTRDLIDAIANGDATEVETSFNNIMAAKVSEKLDNMRADVAQSMFQTPGEPEENFDAETEVTTDEVTTEDNE